MLANTTENLDLLIAEEKSKVAREVFLDAWYNAMDEGIEASILADAALSNALKQLHLYNGPEAVEQLLENATLRMKSGQFDPNHRLQ